MKQVREEFIDVEKKFCKILLENLIKWQPPVGDTERQEVV